MATIITASLFSLVMEKGYPLENQCIFSDHNLYFSWSLWFVIVRFYELIHIMSEFTYLRHNAGSTCKAFQITVDLYVQQPLRDVYLFAYIYISRYDIRVRACLNTIACSKRNLDWSGFLKIRTRKRRSHATAGYTWLFHLCINTLTTVSSLISSFPQLKCKYHHLDNREFVGITYQIRFPHKKVRLFMHWQLYINI